MFDPNEGLDDEACEVCFTFGTPVGCSACGKVSDLVAIAKGLYERLSDYAWNLDTLEPQKLKRDAAPVMQKWERFAAELDQWHADEKPCVGSLYGDHDPATCPAKCHTKGQVKP